MRVEELTLPSLKNSRGKLLVRQFECGEASDRRARLPARRTQRILQKLHHGMKSTILLVDDNATHLQIYEILLDRAGYRSVKLQVDDDPVSLPAAEGVDLMLLDYRLPGKNTALDIAKLARQVYGSVPIIVLSDLMWMPKDIAPHANGFVRKGEPEKLLQVVADTLSGVSRG